MQAIDKLKAMCQIGVNKFSVFRALEEGDASRRRHVATMFGICLDREVEGFCDNIAELCYGIPFREAVTHERIDSEAREAVYRVIARKKLPDGWRRCDSDGGSWSQGDYYYHDSGLVFRNSYGLELPDDEGRFREVQALDVLKLINSTARKAVMV